MKNRSTLVRGVYVAIGLVLGNAVVLPLLSDKSFASGAKDGVITGVIAIGIFAVIAAVKPAKSDDVAKRSDGDPGGPA
jgi:hypothetical protein